MHALSVLFFGRVEIALFGRLFVSISVKSNILSHELPDDLRSRPVMRAARLEELLT
jgi:hypothetical protein